MRAWKTTFAVNVYCHKWLSSAKGSAFLYARLEVQPLLEPLVVSHGWSRRNAESTQYLDYFTWTGTDDPSAYLSVPAAIDFQEQHNWSAVRADCHQLLLEARNRILELSDLQPLSPDTMWSQMSAIPLSGSATDYKNLWEDHQIIVPVLEWNGQTLVRISIQAYNTSRDVDRLVGALQTAIREPAPA